MNHCFSFKATTTNYLRIEWNLITRRDFLFSDPHNWWAKTCIKTDNPSELYGKFHLIANLGFNENYYAFWLKSLKTQLNEVRDKNKQGQYYFR